MTTTKTTKGGARPGAGAKRQGEQAMVGVTVKMEPKQREKLRRLGGAQWVRRKIDEAPELGEPRE